MHLLPFPCLNWTESSKQTFTSLACVVPHCAKKHHVSLRIRSLIMKLWSWWTSRFMIDKDLYSCPQDLWAVVGSSRLMHRITSIVVSLLRYKMYTCDYAWSIEAIEMDWHPLPELPLWQRYYTKNYSSILQKFAWIISNIIKYLFESQSSSARRFSKLFITSTIWRETLALL